ncbi:MAG: hypothetical protein OXG72_12025 [Acidobacteria bacterium]|nr:hypothetical protein [Acidobacteriota bacterium]
MERADRLTILVAGVRASVRRLDDRLRSVEIAIAGTASPQGE